MTDNVTAEVVVDAGGASGRGRITVLRLGWHRRDPLAVHLLLIAQPDHPALPRGHWTVLRDFLRYGLSEPTGDGDVRIRPESTRDRVRLDLLRQGRACRITLPAGVLRDFLDDTERLVAAGAERPEAALEELIERLLRA